jgi:hypothetical protein
MWPAEPAARGAYQSLGRVQPYEGGDLEQPGELARAALNRSYNGELILTYGNEAGTAWIANLVFSLRAAGIEHFLVIVMSAAHCRALMQPPWRISCAWSSWDFGGCKRKMEMRRLWYSRHHYMSRVIGELKLNVAVLDGDIAVRRDFYPELKGPPLAGHNLIYTLDHRCAPRARTAAAVAATPLPPPARCAPISWRLPPPRSASCGNLNVGFAYCQDCAPKGRAQWALDEGLRREGYFCGGQRSEFGEGARATRAIATLVHAVAAGGVSHVCACHGCRRRRLLERFGRVGRQQRAAPVDGVDDGTRPEAVRRARPERDTAPDARAGPARADLEAERGVRTTACRYSDVVGGSCCGAPQYRLMFPGTFKVKDQYAFMRQWGQHAGCMVMREAEANALQTWWHELLQGGGAPETVAIATGRLASGWHGTGAGELAGWSGHWVRTPPALAHFVGGTPAGGKVEIMQGLNWWTYNQREPNPQPPGPARPAC